MLLQRINRTDAEKIFLTVHNVQGSTATTGMGLRFVGGLDTEVASDDGGQAVLLDGNASMWQFAGIADQDIPDDGYGRAQIWGYANSIYLSNVGTQLTISVNTRAETILQYGGAAGTFFSGIAPQAVSTMGYKYVQVWDTVAVSAVAWATGFVRGL